MAYTANQLISQAYYASNIVSRDFQTVSGAQIGDGLIWLNEIITDATVDEGMIPYETTYTFNTVAGDGIYEIPGCIKIDTLVFYKDSVRYAMEYQKRNEFFGSPRVESITALPFDWYFERQLGGGNLHIYFLPDQIYQMEIHGVFSLEEISLGDDLSETFDKFYISYLKYALADRICVNYEVDTPISVIKQLNRYQAFINKKSRLLDLRLNKMSTLQSGTGYNWAYVNLGRGFVPS